MFNFDTGMTQGPSFSGLGDAMPQSAQRTGEAKGDEDGTCQHLTCAQTKALRPDGASGIPRGLSGFPLEFVVVVGVPSGLRMTEGSLSFSLDDGSGATVDAVYRYSQYHCDSKYQRQVQSTLERHLQAKGIVRVWGKPDSNTEGGISVTAYNVIPRDCNELMIHMLRCCEDMESASKLRVALVI